MQSYKQEKSLISPNSLNTISDLAAKNICVGVGTASFLYPLDILLHALYTQANLNKSTIVSAQPSRTALMTAAWLSYKTAVAGATMKVATKQQSQGAKAYLLDEKFTPIEEGVESIEGVPELLEPKMSKQSSLRNTGATLAASSIFGVAEGIITSRNANNSVLNKEFLLATRQGRVFELPHLKTMYDKIRYRFAGLPIRSAKSTLQVAAFSATDFMEKYLLAKGYDARTAKMVSITSVATGFGFWISLLNRGHTEQILTMNPKTISVDSVKKIIPNMIKHSGAKRLFMESAMTMFYTGVVQAIVPPLEKYVDDKIIPKKHHLQSSVTNKFALFNQNVSSCENTSQRKPEEKHQVLDSVFSSIWV